MKKITTTLFSLLFTISPVITTAQWIDASGNLPDFPVGWAIDVIDNSTAIVSGHIDAVGKLFKTTDTGTTWNEIIFPQTGGQEAPIDISSIDGQNIWIATDRGKILRTTNGGANWTEQFNNTSITTFMNYFEMFDASNGIAMGDVVDNNGHAQFLTTTNGGEVWEVKEAAIGRFSGDTWRRTDFVNSNVGYFYESGINPQKLYKTTDGCQSWNVVDIDVYAEVLKAFDENTVLVCNSSIGFFRTFDGGNNWIELPFNTAKWGADIEFCPGDQSKIWYTDGSGVYFSADTGNTWTLQMTLWNEDYGRDIEFLDENNGWILTDKGIFRTTNGGAGITEAGENVTQFPKEFSIYQNFPNPFNPATVIRYQIAGSGFINIKVYDVLGKEVAELVNETKAPGEYQIEFDGSQLPSGIYFYKLTAGDFSQTRKMLLMK